MDGVMLEYNGGIKMGEMVDHPSHYTAHGKKECIEEMREKYGDTVCAIFCLTNIYKYLYRKELKGRREEDLRKACWYYKYYKSINAYDKQMVSKIACDIDEMIKKELIAGEVKE